MSRAALRAEDVEAFRLRTVEAATRLFAEQGYPAVTMRAIAAELGTSAMAPYRYFENKAEIFALVRAEAFRKFSDVQEAALRSTDLPLERLFAMRPAYVQFAQEHPDSYRVMFALDQESEERYPTLAEQRTRSFRCLENAVRGAVDAGVLAGDPLTVAHQLWATTHGIVTLHLSGKLTLGRSLEDLLRAPPIRFKVG
jgi:AcrR family transcriptional regulator